MSNPLAVSILAKLSHYYTCDGDLLDSIGTDGLTSGDVVTYEAGLNGAQRAASNSRAYATLASPIAFGPTSASLSLGGMFYYDGDGLNTPEFGYSYGTGAGNEAFKIVTSVSGYFYTETFHADRSSSSARDPLENAVDYPVTVRVEDSGGDSATSNQVIRIANPGGTMATGWYFVAATWENGVRKLYRAGVLVDTEAAPPTTRETSIPRLEIGRNYSPDTTACAMQYLFACDNAVLTAEELAYIYNAGDVKTLADIQADAA